MTPAGFPHSDILGSKPVCGSPRLIAADYVLHRLSTPRHPPYTLSSLTKLEFSLLGESYCYKPNSVVKDPVRIAGIRASERLRTAHPSSLPCLLSALVELIGIEPTTPGLQSRCSPS